MTVPLWEERRSDLAALHAAALKAADPASAVRRALSIEGDRLLGDAPHVRIVALGKASIAMPRGGCDVLGRRVAAGVVAHPSGLPPGGDWPVGIRFVAAGHPLPDPASLDDPVVDLRRVPRELLPEGDGDGTL